MLTILTRNQSTTYIHYRTMSNWTFDLVSRSPCCRQVNR